MYGTTSIVIGDVQDPLYTLDTSQLRSVVTRVHCSLIGEELRVDELDFICTPYSVYVTSESEVYVTSDSGVYCIPEPVFSVPYGTPIYYYQNDSLVAKFYIASIKRVSEYECRVTAVSALGIMDQQMHFGNVYDMVDFEHVVGEIIDGAFPWTCDPSVATIKISNWLPYATKRENLHQLLFACGVMLRKDSHGDLLFTAPQTYSATQITKNVTFMGGTVDHAAPATSVELTEHAYKAFDTDVEETLFDNTDGSQQASGTLVTFKNAPVHSLRVEGQLTLVSSGVNYAVVNGVGKLFGRPYTHTTRVINAYTGIVTHEPKVVSITDAYLVNLTNSINVLNRMQSYYGVAQTIKVDIMHSSERPGDRIQLPHPFGGEVDAFIKSMTLKSGGFVRASCEVLVGYDPGSAGNNYKNCATYTEDGQFVVPQETKHIAVVLIGGGQGGYSGGQGEPGTEGALSGGMTSGTSGLFKHGSGGSGGVVGPGGSGGRVLSVSLDVEPGQVYDVRIGAGGAGGICMGLEPTAGALGEPTVFGTYSSETGISTVHGFTELFSGQTVAVPGMAGVAPGGDGSGVNMPQTSLTVLGRVFYSGEQGEYVSDYGENWSGEAYGGFGGGPAYGADGGRGYDGSVEYNGGKGLVGGGSGGSGATPTYAGADADVPGSGGQGGSGGGGGGGAGGCAHDNTAGMWPGSGGAGGLGSSGGFGATGVCYVYY